MKYGFLFSILALLLTAAAVLHGGAWWGLMWPATSAAIVAAGYLRCGPRVYGKTAGGTLSPLNQFLLLPFLLYLWAVWYAVRLFRREPAFNQLTDHIYIGRRLLTGELPDHIDHVVDLTCEFNEPRALRGKTYHSFPILDGFTTSPDQLRHWAEQVAGLEGNVYIHCAEGHGRTGLFAAVLLLHLGTAPSVEDALQFIRTRRPLVRLGQRQLATLHATRKPA